MFLRVFQNSRPMWLCTHYHQSWLTLHLGQDGGVCPGDNCYFVANQWIDNPDEGEWICKNEHMDAEFGSPIEQSAFEDVGNLIQDLGMYYYVAIKYIT